MCTLGTGFVNAKSIGPGGGATADYEWTTTDTITKNTSPTTTFSLTGSDITELSGATSNSGMNTTTLTVLDYYFLVGGSNSSTFGQYLAVNKANPAEGYLYTASGSSLPSLSQISIQNTNNLAPEPIKYISRGAIWGRAFPYPDATDWKSDADTYITKESIILKYEDPVTKKTVDVAERKIEKDSSGYHYLRMTIGASDFNGGNDIPAGRYRLYYRHGEGGDCATGDAAQGADIKSAIIGCDTVFYGVVNFDLVYLDPSYYGGAAKIVLVGNETENEKASPADGKLTTDITSYENGINIDITEEQQNAFTEALKNATIELLKMINFGITTGGNWIDGILKSGNDIEGSLGVSDVWEQTRNMALGLLTFAIILIAFANILSIDLGNYGLTRILPKMIIAIVLTYFSYLIAVFLLDLMSAFQSLLFQAGSSSGFSLANSVNEVLRPDALDNVSAIAELVFLVILGAGLFIAVMWLCIVLVVRSAMLFVLIAIAPIAFMANILPFTETYYKKWWAEFWKWAFMGPAVAFMLWLSGAFLSGYLAAKYGSINPDTPESWVFLIGAAVLIFMTATLPLKMGGEIMKQATKPVTGTGKWGYKQTGVPAFLEQRKAAGNKIPQRRGQKMWASVAQVPGLRRVVAGTDKRGADEARAALKADFAKSFVRMTKDELNKNLEEGKFKGIEQEAAIDYLTGNGQLDLDKANVARLVAERLTVDGGFMNTFKDKQGDGFSKLTTNATALGLSPDARKLVRGEADKSIAGKAGFELKPAQIEHLAKNNPEYLEQLLGDEEYMKAIAEKGGPGAKAAWGEAIKHYAQRTGHAPKAKGPEHDKNLRKLAEAATNTELRARELAGKPVDQGGKGLDEHGRPKSYEGKNAWGEGGKESWIPRGDPYQSQNMQRPSTQNQANNQSGNYPPGQDPNIMI